MNQSVLSTYQKLCTEFYDLELAHNKDAVAALSFYMDYAQQAKGPILEPMCGTGRFLIPMLQAGLDIEGFDASEHMLNALKQKYAALSSHKPPVWQQFVQDFSSHKHYHLIFIPFGSWGLITDQEHAKKSVDIMFRHLAPGGKFVIEIETIASAPQPHGVWRRGIRTRADGSRIVINTLTSYDSTTHMFESICRYESIINNTIVETETEIFQQYLYRFDEMDQLLKDAGFIQIKKYQDYAKAPATNLDVHTIIYECIK